MKKEEKLRSLQEATELELLVELQRHGDLVKTHQNIVAEINKELNNRISKHLENKNVS